MRKWLTIYWLCMVLPLVSGQELPLAATVQVIAADVTIQRAGASNSISLPIGALAPIGPDDVVRTSENGRALIDYAGAGQAFLLPNSMHVLSALTQDRDERVIIHSRTEGIVLFDDITEQASLSIATNTFTLQEAVGRFGIWGYTPDQSAVVMLEGAARIVIGDEVIHLGAEGAWKTTLGLSVYPLPEPANPARLVGRELGCIGLIDTAENEGLLIRQGNGIGYRAIGLLPEGSEVLLIGVDERDRRLRVQFDSGFGWVDVLGVDHTCTDLLPYTGDQIEQNARITNVTEAELPLLEPYFGTPLENNLFYD